MRLARVLIGLVYGSIAIVAAAVFSAPWWVRWVRGDGDLGFGFLVAGVFALWLRVALGMAVAGTLTALWAFWKGGQPRRRSDLPVTLASAAAVVALGWTVTTSSPTDGAGPFGEHTVRRRRTSPASRPYPG